MPDIEYHADPAPSADPVATAPESTGQPEAAPEAPVQEPAATSPAPQTPQYDPNQVQTWQRQAQLYEGGRVLTDPLVQAGIKTPDDLKPLIDLYNTAKERGSSVDQITGLLRGQQPQQAPAQEPPQPNALTPDELDRRLDMRDAKSLHQSSFDQMKSGLTTMRESVAQELNLPADSMLLDRVEAIASDAYERSFYPPEHPLHNEQYKPLDSNQLQSLRSQAAEAVKAEVAKLKIIQAQGQQKLASTPTQPSGNTLESTANEQAPRRFSSPRASTNADDVSRAAAIIAQNEARRHGGVPNNSV